MDIANFSSSFWHKIRQKFGKKSEKKEKKVKKRRKNEKKVKL